MGLYVYIRVCIFKAYFDGFVHYANKNMGRKIQTIKFKKTYNYSSHYISIAKLITADIFAETR